MVQAAAECRAAVGMDEDLAVAEETALNNILTFFCVFFHYYKCSFYFLLNRLS